jgi:hypothetical protein
MTQEQLPGPCVTCPSRALRFGEFVLAKERTKTTLDSTGTYRVNKDQTPTCIHPERLGPTAPRDTDEALAITDAPDNTSELGAWIAATIAQVPGEQLQEALDQLHERAVDANFSSDVFVAALRSTLKQLSTN